MKRLFAISALVVAAACGGGQPERRRRQAPQAIQPPAIDAQAVLAHTKTLSSDEFEGRAPGTRGEDLTVAYIAEQFKKAGVKPGNPDGTYFQKVPMVGITADPGATLVVPQGRPRAAPQVPRRRGGVDQARDGHGHPRQFRCRLRRVRGPGAGVQLGRLQGRGPEGQDDGGAGERPAVPDPADPAQLDPKTFGGRAMTYYGRWTYKYEMGQKMGAAARAHRARDRAGGVPVRGGAGQDRRSSSASWRPTRT